MATEVTLESCLRRLDAFFRPNSRGMTPEQIHEWGMQLRRVPSEALESIVSDCIRDDKYMPTPQEILDRWQGWKSAHPERMRPEVPETYCEWCYSSGGLDVIRVGEYGRTVVRCGHCENWKRTLPNRGIAIMTASEVLSRGWKLLNVRRLETDGPRNTWRPVKQLAAKAMREIPEPDDDQVPF